MSIINSNSAEGLNSKLMLFSLPPTDTSITNVNIIEFRPTSQITGSNPITYEIPSSGIEYKALSEATHRVKFRVIKIDGSVPPAEAKVAPVNLTLQSLFKQVDVFLDGKLVSSSDNNYHYRAMIETLMNYGNSAKNSQLQSQLFYKDKGKMDSTDPITGDNPGLQARHSYTKLGTVCTLEGKIFTSLNNITRLLLNGIRISYKFYRNPDSIVLMSPDDGLYKIELLDHAIKIPYVSVSSSVIVSHAEMLKTTPAMYPMKRSEVKSFAVASGSLNLNQLISQDLLPHYVIIGFVSSKAYNGSITDNCYNFQNYAVNYMNLTVDGQSVSNSPFEIKFSVNEIQYAHPYLSLFKVASKFNLDCGNDISFSDFRNGYSLFAFEVNSLESQNSDVLYPSRTGSLRLTCKFDDPLDEPINVITYSVFDSVIHIDQTRSITIE